jgi:hypothetical protein
MLNIFSGSRRVKKVKGKGKAIPLTGHEGP